MRSGVLTGNDTGGAAQVAAAHCPNEGTLDPTVCRYTDPPVQLHYGLHPAQVTATTTRTRRVACETRKTFNFNTQVVTEIYFNDENSKVGIIKLKAKVGDNK